MGGFIFLWFVLAILVGVAGKSRSIGFGWAFGLSLILSPLIGIIIVLLSKTKKEMDEENRWVAERELGKKAEFKGQVDQAIDHYMDSLYHLENDFKDKKLDQKSDEGRQKIIKTLTEKVETLKKLKSGNGTSN